MFLSRIQLYIVTIILMIILPVLILIGLFLSKDSNFTSSIIYVFFAWNFMFLLFKTAPWEFTNYYLRYIFALSFFIVSVINIIYISKKIQNGYQINIYWDGGLLFLSLFLIYLNIRVIRASIKPNNYINLVFPFKNGKYIVTDGGDGKACSLINYHTKAQIHKKGNSNTSMRYATDIAKINHRGYTVKSVLVKENKEYEIFHEKVYCPCEAMVIKVVDGIENNIPFSRKYPYNVGNHVVLKQDDYYIIMGHLEKNSIVVKEGSRVKPYEQLGDIGNGGLSPRPHLHMQVSKCEDGQYWSGEGIAIVFNDSYYPTKNKIIIV